MIGQKIIPFTIDIRPRVIDDAKVIVNVEVINNVGRPVDYRDIGRERERGRETSIGEIYIYVE